MTSTQRVVLAGGTLVDGRGSRPEVADLVIDGPSITEITSANEGTTHSGAEVVDCSGLIVAPGFIDIHTHSDLTRLHYPEAQTRVAQGITTEVTGNCGMSPFPVTDNVAELRSKVEEMEGQLKSVVAILGRNPSRNDVVRAIELKEGQQARVANVVAASRC